MRTLGSVLSVGLLFAAVVFAGPVGPVSLAGDEILALGGQVDVYFVGQTAGFDSVINLTSPVFIGPFFHNHLTAPGTMLTLGTFAAGTPLIFRLDVLNTGISFFTGPASRNPDNIVHAGITTWVSDSFIPADGLRVGFEDLLNGGDLDFDDNLFVFANVRQSTVPEPGTCVLLSAALGVIAVARRRK